LGLTFLGILTLYFAKNIKVSVTGAEAVIEEPGVQDEENPEAEVAQREFSETKTTKQSFDRPETSQADLSLIDQMVKLINERKLCEFLSFARENSQGKFEQFQALEKSFSDPEIQELEVFLEGDVGNASAYQTEAARFYLVGKQVGAFQRQVTKEPLNFEKGLEEEDQRRLEAIEVAKNLNPDNLLYAMAKNNVLRRYTHRGEALDAELYEEITNSEEIENPVFSLLRKIYNRSKDNVAQFYLSQEILQKDVRLDRHFVLQIIWYYYSQDTRAHIHQLLGNYLEGSSEATEIFGYESNLYELYKYSAPPEVYVNLPEHQEYDDNREHPVYKLADLKIDMESGCDQAKVDELAIKLRAL
jgi:hypothetical protein